MQPNFAAKSEAVKSDNSSEAMEEHNGGTVHGRVLVSVAETRFVVVKIVALAHQPFALNRGRSAAHGGGMVGVSRNVRRKP